MRQTVGILGTPIDILNTAEVVARIEQFVEQRRFHQIATANTDFVVNAVDDPELRYILRNSDLVIPDGMPLVWASRMMRSRLPERVTGVDLVPQLAALAARNGYRLFMLGARPEVAQQACRRLQEDHPGLNVVGCLSPPMAPLLDMDHSGIVAEIKAARPDILLVAFGNPKQEKWIHMNRAELQSVSVCLGVGGTFDFIAGVASRAPQWMQRSGLEWVHRLSHEPRRLHRRYARDFAHFSRYLLQQWSLLRHFRLTGESHLEITRADDYTRISVSGDLSSLIASRLQDAADAALCAGTHLLVDVHNVRGVDGEALGLLLNLPKRAIAFHREMRIARMSPAMQQLFQVSGLCDAPYRAETSRGTAFATALPTGMTMEVIEGPGAVTLRVCGHSDVETVEQFVTLCQHILAKGKRLDLDFRGLQYADLMLVCKLQSLLSLPENCERVRILPGDVLLALLQREKAEHRFCLRTSADSKPELEERYTDVREYQDIYAS